MNHLSKKIKTLIDNAQNSLLSEKQLSSLAKLSEQESFRKKIHEMEAESNLSLQAVKEVFLPFIKTFDYPNEDAFEKDLYQYALFLTFPEKFDYPREYELLYSFFMKLLRVVYLHESKTSVSSVYFHYPVELLEEKYFRNFDAADEYGLFIQTYYNQYVYETMRMGMDLFGFNTLEHVIMIHHLAVSIGRQMHERGFEVDMCKISAASLGHDIGKFGCSGDEVARVPYLHYYYTDVWFKRGGMPSTGHIAQNHSVWDLEIENLPIESLVLIYCDFRVKNDEKGKMTIFSLKDSFNVILAKLDNVDEAKVKRYQRAYEKLKDFENYLLHSGVDLQDPTLPAPPKEQKPYAVLFDREITDNLKFYAISNNIHIMHLLRSEASLTNLLELARTDRNNISLRDYLDIFKEYSTHLSQKQKSLMMKFLFETIINPEEDIRIEAARLIGVLAANYDEDYRKELPKNAAIQKEEIDSAELFYLYARKMLHYQSKIIPVHRKWLGLAFSYFAKSFAVSINETVRLNKIVSLREKVRLLIDEFESDDTALMYLMFGFYKMDAIDRPIISSILHSSAKQRESEAYNLRCICLMTVKRYASYLKKDEPLFEELRSYLSDYSSAKAPVSLNYIHQKMATEMRLDELIPRFRDNILHSEEKVSDIFLSNLKTATSAIQKMIQIDILKDHALSNVLLHGTHTTMHFCNILKVSETELVRSRAGNAITKLFARLHIEQKNDIAVELLRSLEIQDYKFAKFIPAYLGEVLLLLPSKEFDEIIDDFEIKIKSSNSDIHILILNTLGRSVSLYEKYPKNSPSKPENKRRLFKMIGVILSCLAHYKERVKTEALSVLSKQIFASGEISAELKAKIFRRLAKKILTHLPRESVHLRQLSIGSSMNAIYRYISDYELHNGKIIYESKQNIAFFPGTFDPFTLSHKNIATTIRDLDMEVYLAVDEFSWSKRTHPHHIRRNIVRMSIADELDIYIYPSNMPVNLTNDEDIRALQSHFEGKKLYIATGKDVVKNASAYKKDSLIRSIPHIIFDRSTERLPYQEIVSRMKESLQEGSVNDDLPDSEDFSPYVSEYRLLHLDDEFKHISSTLIRDCVDEGKDISNMLDPTAEKFILEKGLYKKEPLFKKDAQSIRRKVELYKYFDSVMLQALMRDFPNINLEKLRRFCADDNIRVMRMIDTSSEQVLGYALFKWMPTTSLYANFEDKEVCDTIRSVYVGRMAHLGCLVGDEHTMKLLLTETLAYALEKDYTFMVTSDSVSGMNTKYFQHILRQSGFAPISEDRSIFYANMSNPCSFLMDIENYIKSPFIAQESIQNVIEQSRERMKQAISKLYPGNLVLNFDNYMFNEKLIERICNENKVPSTPTLPRTLGDKMCVPFGHVLSKTVVPNTVTKSLHIEKVFRKDMSGFSIRAYPYYLSLEKQLKTVRSFDREVLLVDDILNKGYRIKALDPLLKGEGIRVSKVITGILTGRGKELMDIQGREVDYAYFIPKLKVWFNESVLYPFISGDGIEGTELLGAAIPSINLTLPYTSPYFIKEASKEAVYEFSLTCLENSKLILESLEKEYEQISERKLTISSLNEVMVFPRVVDYGNHLSHIPNACPSSYVAEDIERLKRMRRSVL
ncbi:MAG: cytidyltransferase [Peptostreptococcaceae bacterium]|nr:cytidyltransferase [Peptostreptococcaceae bacterium]